MLVAASRSIESHIVLSSRMFACVIVNLWCNKSPDVSTGAKCMCMEHLQAKLSRARQAQMFDKDGKPFFRPSTGRAPSERGGSATVPRWESLYSQRNQAEEKRQQLKKQLEDEQRQARSAATRVNPKSEKMLARASLTSVLLT